ncbi:MAG TPA: LLM class F420-dependent oxidoreductase [Candidatus Binatia bacterium]|nr:LLM class F420-dependent oxidoreductase [Candidatus Binatia bacterium]
MDIGISTTVTAQSGDLAEVARQVEALGYDSLWIPEHPVVPIACQTPFPASRDGQIPDHYKRWADPFIALTVAATATKTIKLGTGICLLPERDPLITAKVVASVDFYSGGRVILGVGAGWLREETELMGTRFSLRWKRLRESVEAMRVLWTQAEASYQGELIRFPAVRCEPKPVQKPCPPVLLGALGHKALERVARTYDGWYPFVQSPNAFQKDMATLRKLTAEAGRNPDTLQVTAIVDPRDGTLSVDELKRYRDAGAGRVVVYSQQTRKEDAEGKALEVVKRSAAIVERAQHV